MSNKQDFTIHLDEPKIGHQFSEHFNLRGWVSTKNPTNGKVKVRVNDGEFIELKLLESREDVAKVFKLNSDRVGFQVQIPFKKAGLVKLETVYEESEKTISAEPLILECLSSQTTLNRTNYKEVWDGAASNHSDAMLVVSGENDFQTFMESGICTAKTIVARASILKSDVVLEIGCGTGRIGAALAPQCKEWIGTDISEKMIGYAKENLKAFTNIKLVELPACNLEEFADSSIDVVYCSVVFMHLEEWDRYRYIQDSFRILKNGGRIYVDNLNLAGDEGWKVFSDLAKFDTLSRPLYISKSSTRIELETYLMRAGFQNIKTAEESLLVSAWAEKL